MNNASEFLEMALDKPHEFLGINDEEGLKLAVTFLKGTKDQSFNGLLEKTITAIFRDIIDKDLQLGNFDNPAFKPINTLLDSSWRTDVIDKIFDLYLSEASTDCFLDVWIENYLVTTRNSSIYLATEKLADYFVYTVHATTAQKAIYCCHAINILFEWYSAPTSFDSGFNPVQFIELVRQPLLSYLRYADFPVKRLAVWAIYWMIGGRMNVPSVIAIDRGLCHEVELGLDGDLDIVSQLRLCTTLIKSAEKLFAKLDRSLTRKWALEIQTKKIASVGKGQRFSGYSNHIEEICLNAVRTLPHQNWLDQLVIPYLAFTASDEAIQSLKNFLTGDDRLKLRASVILCGMGILKSEDIDTFSLRTTMLDATLIKSSGHLIHKLKAKDSTGRWAYYFVLVEEYNEAEFLKAIEGDGTIDLENFGIVVASCYGESPTREVKNYLWEKYGFEV